MKSRKGDHVFCITKPANKYTAHLLVKWLSFQKTTRCRTKIKLFIYLVLFRTGISFATVPCKRIETHYAKNI